MFGQKRKEINNRLEAVEQRITHNSEILEEDHGYVIELRTQIARLSALVEAQEARIEALEQRQQSFRHRLVSAIDMPYKGHTCVNKDGQPSTVATCVECNKDD